MLLPWRMVDGISTSLTERETARLRGLAAGRRVLEIGSAYGWSAIQMAACPGTRVLAIDPHAGENPDSLSVMRSNLQAHGVCERVTIMLGRSEDVLPVLQGVGARFDLVFVDGCHHEAAVTRDVAHARGLLEPRGAIACHDFGEDSCRGVKAALGALYPDGPDELVDTLWVKRFA